MKFLLDTNFLLIPGQFKIDIFSELNKYGKPKLFTLDLVVQELKTLSTGKGKDSAAAKLALELLQQKKVDICGFGRMAFANPDFPKQILKEEGMIDKKKTCITCSKCSSLMRQGKSTGCVVRDAQYKS